mmetsp:Transcript_20986/g.47455  ORF Transcript_20986/g.47455 Transcript_20986/m.47455 type:complete len:267 (-) Transcript_20986:3537-4337(-)
MGREGFLPRLHPRQPPRHQAIGLVHATVVPQHRCSLCRCPAEPDRTGILHGRILRNDSERDFHGPGIRKLELLLPLLFRKGIQGQDLLSQNAPGRTLRGTPRKRRLLRVAPLDGPGHNGARQAAFLHKACPLGPYGLDAQQHGPRRMDRPAARDRPGSQDLVAFGLYPHGRQDLFQQPRHRRPQPPVVPQGPRQDVPGNLPFLHAPRSLPLCRYQPVAVPKSILCDQARHDDKDDSPPPHRRTRQRPRRQDVLLLRNPGQGIRRGS